MERKKEKLRQETNFSKKRIGWCIGIALLFLIGSFYHSTKLGFYVDEVFCIIVLNVVFLMMIFLELMHVRLAGKMRYDKITNFHWLFFIVFICWGLQMIGGYCPEFFAPMLGIGLLLSSVIPISLAFPFGIYFACMTGLVTSAGVPVFLCYCFLVIFGVVIGNIFHYYKVMEAFGLYLYVFSLQMIIPILFYYMSYHELKKQIFFIGLIEGIIDIFVCLLCQKFLIKEQCNQNNYQYERLLEPTFELVKDIENYSMAEFLHGKRVSKLAYMCAEEIGGNVQLAACGGFYYRIGKMEGEPIIDNAIKLANHHCFPTDVIDILQEYGGIVRKPQTRESAIVHMIDLLVTKIELLDQDTMSSTWNQDMVIYQTLNELSQQGFYDESGLSMNQFLRIREKLVNEDILG